MRLHKNLRIGLMAGVIVGLLLIAVTGLQQFWFNKSLGQAMLGTPRPAFTLPDLAGNDRAVAAWDGQVVLVNFWATWCPPCRHEIPLLNKLQRRYREAGLQVVGVAIDKRQAVTQFDQELPLEYPVLHGQLEASQVARAYGNEAGVLPYTVIVDRQGMIRYVKAGEVSADRLTEALRALL